MASFTCPYTDAQLRRFLFVEMVEIEAGWSDEEILEHIEPNIPCWRHLLDTLGAAPKHEAVLAFFTSVAINHPHVVQTEARMRGWAQWQAQFTRTRIKALRRYFSVTT